MAYNCDNWVKLRKLLRLDRTMFFLSTCNNSYTCMILNTLSILCHVFPCITKHYIFEAELRLVKHIHCGARPTLPVYPRTHRYDKIKEQTTSTICTALRRFWIHDKI